ncbi:hypothetical protein HanXRQr2_Chr06g0260771 [Helianthus annuus]|uniref:Uncharacterized protein n=1 Tax=Helianthus annuus TaxID=4232 RepID=A0A9K3IT76_HELAN|nr:hypothetical protein HanXRQr2_Chr06g0260771 [Helianthus annuus]
MSKWDCYTVSLLCYSDSYTIHYTTGVGYTKFGVVFECTSIKKIHKVGVFGPWGGYLTRN